MKNVEDPEWFWSIIERADLSRDRLEKILKDCTKQQLIKFQEKFVDASIELQDAPFTDYMEESEDGMEDIANWIVSNGRDFYIQITKNPDKIPTSVNDFTHQILFGVADEVCVEKYGESTGVY